MIASLYILLALGPFLSFASPFSKRIVSSLNPAAFKEAQQRDDTATRAFADAEIKTSDGKCLFVNELSGDFRANLNPIQVAPCDGSMGQRWDVISKGKHNDQVGTILLVNTLTQACMNFDPRRAAGKTVIMFSCGGRADGGGAVTNSQLFNFSASDSTEPLTLQPTNAAGTCLAVTTTTTTTTSSSSAQDDIPILDQAPCQPGDASQKFTISEGAAIAAPASPQGPSSPGTVVAPVLLNGAASSAATPTQEGGAALTSICIVTTIVTQTQLRVVAKATVTVTASASIGYS
ncbi:uncharacterized protein L3040_008058 [Drepanopeziza brunnea f. sp. 'multigermtubi']|uniref:Mg2+ transporter protein n=1 Tax=Marssonina brunnea f. sp. multigermtubi (strain MB_m1) TaxID=1072389 RepID=K1WXH9_MARBU|nr:Mg2+ transporter protein [Drepanopeziza brunnea f. sp. 'multigermtubi' MB_m1]EKD17756.1 Mg2+ transporter protein [Drepanopeziza brunnea f. sp. 'multigermtubi' MB_m1]KAJ5035593.1 hypothetical protein L3040_008058 [Drepanopeziza brunnea f. sp. 'multigermtubi']